MELIDRYATAVGKSLPRKNRADIESEIRSTLEDMLADRAEKSGRPADEAMVKELLIEYGAPDKVAATYQVERYLIGPRMFPLFWLVVRIVFAVLTTLAVIGLGIQLGMNPVDPASAASIVGKSLLEYFNGMMVALGNIVLIFAILERVLPELQIKQMNPSEPEEWNPDQLMKEPSGDEVKTADAVLAILFTSLGLIFLNFYPQIISIVTNLNGLVIVPILSDAFFAYLPWINLLWGLEIILQVALLRQGRYTTATRLCSIVLKAGGLALAVAMLLGPSLIGITTEELVAAGFDPTAAASLIELFNLMIRIGLAIAIVANAVDIVKSIYRLVARPTRLSPGATQL